MKKVAHLSLWILAACTGELWRLEMDYHGWEGLTWISYFHYAIPVNFLLLLIWSNFYLPPLDRIRRTCINVAIVALAIAAYIIVYKAAVIIFATGPMAMVIHFGTPKWILWTYVISGFFILAGLPLIITLILKRFNLIVKRKNFYLSVLLYWMSFPFVTGMVIFYRIGSRNFMEAIKTGWLFPFIIFAIGLLMIDVKDEEVTE